MALHDWSKKIFFALNTSLTPLLHLHRSSGSPCRSRPPFRHFPSAGETKGKNWRKTGKTRGKPWKMGIKDLLRYMKPFIASVHIKKYAGKRVKNTLFSPKISYKFAPFLSEYIFPIFCILLKLDFQVGIDAYSWLHKGGEIFLNTNIYCYGLFLSGYEVVVTFRGFLVV